MLKALYRFYRASLLRMPLTLKRHERRRDGHDGLLFKLAMLAPALAYGLVRMLEQRRAPAAPSCQLAIVAIVKDEAPYLVEWIEYHRLVGVERFYLYDNDSCDGTAEMLAPYIDAGLVVYRPMSGHARQLDAYNDALMRYGHMCRYLAFLDADEFVVALPAGLPAYLDHHLVGSAAGLALNWLIFGSSGFMRRPEGLVIENYVCRSDPAFDRNCHIKTICRPEKVLGMPNVHYCCYLPGSHAVDVYGNTVAEAFSAPLSEVPMPHVNHYFSKSLDEFKAKRARGCADEHATRPLDDFYVHDRNEVRDESMLPFAEQLRSSLRASRGPIARRHSASVGRLAAEDGHDEGGE